MKFFNKQENIEVEFWSTYEGLEDVYPIVSATKYIPNWFKQMPNFTGKGEPKIEDKGTLKNCPGFVDFFTNAYVMPLWTDVELEVGGRNNFKFIASNKQFKFESHPAEQFLDHVQNTGYTLTFKPISPWRCRTPKGYSILQLPMFYDFNPDFDTLPGVRWTDIHHSMNPQMCIKRQGRISLKAGTPLAMYIPIKRENYDLKIKPYDAELQHAEKINQTKIWSKFVGAYREMQKE